MTTNKLYAEWKAIITRRVRYNTCGQDGSDFEAWLKWRGIPAGQHQLELF